MRDCSLDETECEVFDGSYELAENPGMEDADAVDDSMGDCSLDESESAALESSYELAEVDMPKLEEVGATLVAVNRDDVVLGGAMSFDADTLSFSALYICTLAP